MKVALLLRGHVRSSLEDRGLIDFVELLKSKYEVDIYIHTWDESEAKLSWRGLSGPKPTSESDVRNYFEKVADSVKCVLVDNDLKSDAHLKGRLDGHICRIPRIAWKRMWHGIQRGMNSIVESNEKYDAVVNTRFDVLNFFHFNGVDRRLWSPENLVGVVENLFEDQGEVSFVYDHEHICIDNFYAARPEFMRKLVGMFNDDLDAFDFLVGDYDHGHEKLVFKIAQKMLGKKHLPKIRIGRKSHSEANAPRTLTKDELLGVLNEAGDVLFAEEEFLVKYSRLLRENIARWSKSKCSVMRGELGFVFANAGKGVVSKLDLEEKDGWYVPELENESERVRTSGTSNGLPFEYMRWHSYFHKIEWDYHYNLILDEFEVPQNPHILYFFSSFYKTDGEKPICSFGEPSELMMNNHGSSRHPVVHYANFEVYKRDPDFFFKYLFQYIEDNPMDVLFTSSPQINSICSHLRRFGIKRRLAGLLSQTNDRFLQEDAKFLLDGGYFGGICDHMRCWDGGASFFTCKHGTYHLMDNLSWCEQGPNNELICTDYFNLASPFVRYWNGDYCKIGDEYKRCGCGRLYREFELLESRPFSLKGVCIAEIRKGLKNLGISGIKQVRCSTASLDVVSDRVLDDEEKSRISAIDPKFVFRFILEPD